MSTAHYEYWWQKSGRFNMDLYNNILRAKRDAEFQSNIQDQGWQMEGHPQNNSSQQSRGCNSQDRHVASVNY